MCIDIQPRQIGRKGMGDGIQDISADDPQGSFGSELLLQSDVYRSPRRSLIDAKQAAGFIKSRNLKGEIFRKIKILGDFELEIMSVQPKRRLVIYGAGLL